MNGIDPRTLHTYHTNAHALCQRYRHAVPADLYHRIQQVFHAGHTTADIGCGSGRDVVWLVAQGFPTTGYDASPAMLNEARAAYPHIDVREARLPDLKEIPDSCYANMLCSATLMHLPRAALPPATRNLARIIQPGGRLLLSYRHSTAPTEREHDGRLFTTIAPDDLAALLKQASLSILTTEQQADAERPGVWWNVVVVERAYS